MSQSEETRALCIRTSWIGVQQTEIKLLLQNYLQDNLLLVNTRITARTSLVTLFLAFIPSLINVCSYLCLHSTTAQVINWIKTLSFTLTGDRRMFSRGSRASPSTSGLYRRWERRMRRWRSLRGILGDCNLYRRKHKQKFLKIKMLYNWPAVIHQRFRII